MPQFLGRGNFRIMLLCVKSALAIQRDFALNTKERIYFWGQSIYNSAVECFISGSPPQIKWRQGMLVYNKLSGTKHR